MSRKPKTIDSGVLDFILDKLSNKKPATYTVPPVPKAIPQKLAAGARVALVSRVYDTAEVGWLEKEAWTGSYHVHTIVRDDGSRYRTEGRIFAIEEES